MSNLTAAGTTCLILEDSTDALQILQDTLNSHYPGLQQHTAANLLQADQQYHQHLPQLLILDVNLPDGNCFEWLRKITNLRHVNFSVIIITAHAGYAIDALKFSAIDFLLKPYMPSDLLSAVEKGLRDIGDRDYQRKLEIFFHNHDHAAREDKKIVLKTLDEIFIVAVSDILALQADNSYTQFKLKNGSSILVSQPIKEYDLQLSPLGFMRVHQSYLINLKAIKTFKKKSNQLLLENEIEVPVSQHKKAVLMEYLNTL